jgi:hypothetical protein
MTDHLTLLTAIFSAIATGLAAYATWRAPTAAARLAEALRREADLQDQRQRQKLSVFATLMQERAQIYSESSVRALNLIDVVFNDSREVREAWSELYLAFYMTPIPEHVLDERLRKLLGAIAKNIGLADELRNDDLGRVYYPKVQQQKQFIEDMQRQQIIASLQGQNAAGASPPDAQNTLWPPKPV